MAFFDLCVLHFERVLEETHGAAYLEVVREVLKEGRAEIIISRLM